MRTVKVFEEPEELLEALVNKEVGECYLVLSDDYDTISLSGTDSNNYSVDFSKDDSEEFIKLVFQKIGIQVHVT